MSEEPAVYLKRTDIDPCCPPQFAEYITDAVVRILGVLAEVREYQGCPYWQAFEECEEHERPFVTYQTAQGHLVPFRHAVIDARECVSWCYLKKSS